MAERNIPERTTRGAQRRVQRERTERPTKVKTQKQGARRKPETVISRQKRQKAEREYVQKLENASKRFATSFKNVNELEKNVPDFISRNQKKVPKKFRDDFRQLVKREASKVKKNQRKMTEKLERDIKRWREREEKYDDRADEAEKDRRKVRYEGREEYYDEKADEAEKILRNRLKKGEILNSKKLYNFLDEKGDVARDEEEFDTKKKLAEQKMEKAAEEKRMEIKEFVQKPSVMAGPPKAKDIQKELDVTEETAELIQGAVKKGAKSKVKFVKNLKETVEKGARYDKKQLEKAGLSSSEAREILEKQGKENKKTFDIMDSFSDDIAQKFSQIKTQSKMDPGTRFLRYVGESPKQSMLKEDVAKKIEKNLGNIKEVNRLKNLDTFKKNAVLNYSSLLYGKKNIQDRKINQELKDLKDFTKDIKSRIKELRKIGVKGPSKKVKALEKRLNKIKTSDLKKLSEKDKRQLKELSVKQDKEMADLINNAYNYITTENLKNEIERSVSTKKIRSLIDRYTKKLNTKIKFKGVKVPQEAKNLVKSNKFIQVAKNMIGAPDLPKQTKDVLAPFFIFTPFETELHTRFTPNGLSYAATLIDLDKKLDKGKKLTQKEVKEYENGLKDAFGIKSLTKKGFEDAMKSLRKTGESAAAKKTLTAAFAKMFADAHKNFIYLKNQILDTANMIIANLENGAQFTYEIVTKAGIGATDFLKRQALDLYDYAIDRIKQLPKKERSKIVKRTQEDWKKIAETYKTTEKIFEQIKKNPGLLAIGLGVAASQGLKKLRKTVRTNPKRVVAELVTFYLEGKFIEGGINIAKQAKATFSPFVLKNVKIFEKGATKQTMANALLSKQGQKVDLFSATPTKLKKLFKGSNLSKKEFDILVKDMIKHPRKYVDANKRIKPMREIFKSKQRRNVLDFLKQSKRDPVVSGSGSLSLQLKKFRKVGDIDVVIRSPKKFAENLVEYLNKNTVLGKISKIKRYSVKKAKAEGVFSIYDNFLKKKIVDVDDYRLLEKNFQNVFGRKLSNKDFIKKNGVKVLNVESQLPIKALLTSKTSASFRRGKELRDVAKILKGSKNELPQSKWNRVKRFLDQSKEVLNVKSDIAGLGKDRKFYWVKSTYGIDPSKYKEKTIRFKLKKFGLTEADINKNIDLYSPSGFYWAINKVYPYFLKGKGKGGVVFVKNIKIDKYPKSIRQLIKKNLAGELSEKSRQELRKKINRYIKSNPDKVLPGEKAIVDGVGEEEAISEVFTRLFPKKKLVKREVYIPSLRKFVEVQEAVIGKKPQNLKSLYRAFSNKIKKGYNVKDMKRDITNWAKRNLDDFKKKSGVVDTKKEREQLKNLRKTIDDKIDDVSKSKIPKSERKRLTAELRRQKKLLTPRKGRKLTVSRTLFDRTSRLIRKTNRKINKRTTKRTKESLRKARKVTAKKRVSPRKPRKEKPRVKPRVKPRPKGRVKPRVQKPRPPRARKPTKRAVVPRPGFIKTPPPRTPKFRRIKKEWDKKVPSNLERVVVPVVNVNGKRKELNIRTTPNRALNYITKLIDNTKSRSFSLKTVGTTKQKDVQMRTTARKFRPQKRKSSVFLDFKEKKEYKKDTKGERAGLTIGKLIRQTKKKSKKTKKSKNTKKSTKKKTSKKRRK